MSSEARILIFGLATSDGDAEVRSLLGPCGSPRLEFCEVPGDASQAFAVVHLSPDRELAWRLARRVGNCRLHGRRLQTWVPALPWI
ncbi:MAG: hypothetical protein KA141_12040 [Rubrivivax sp.]|jgi:hypothetical protein|nr:hypothetical protein [Rubrivivax sp.]